MSMGGVLLSLLLIMTTLTAVSFSLPSARAYDVVEQVGKPFTLKINQTAYIESEGIEMTFSNVTEDSRCPSDVTCVWAGQVSILVDVKTSTGTSQLVLTLTGGNGKAESFGNYSMRLADVQPYPVSTRKISPSEYVATLVVDSDGNQALSHGVFVKARASDIGAVAGWNVEKVSGAAFLFMQDSPRLLIKFIPSYSKSCSHGSDLTECIDGRVTFASDSSRVPEGENIHVEIDSSRTTMFLTLPGGESAREHALNMTAFKTWSKPIGVVGGGNSFTVYLKEGQRDGPLLVQKIYSDRVEGLNFREYPVATDQGFPITLRVGESASNGCTVTLVLVNIEGDTARFAKTVEGNKPCPICWLQVALTTNSQ